MRKISIIACLVLVVLCGCAKYTTPVVPQNELTGAQKNFESLWQASLDTLRGMGFVIEKEDRRTGIIKTKPLLGKHYLEPWRDDTGSAKETIETTISPIYRTVTVQIVEQGENQYSPQVTVAVARTAKEAEQITSVSDAYGMLVLPGTKSYSKKLEEKEDPQTGESLGESPKLAGKIRAKILARR